LLPEKLASSDSGTAPRLGDKCRLFCPFVFGWNHTTIRELLDLTAERFPNQEAVVVRNRNIRLSYRELRQQVDCLAAGFVALGLKP
jgi:non-ribosomal peptide synthetase component F